MAFTTTFGPGTQPQELTVAAADTAVTNTGDYVLIGTITNKGIRRLRITSTVGAAALTGFKVTAAAKVGGTHVEVASDAGFNTTTATVREATANLYQTTNAGVFKLELDVTSMSEIKLYAKAGGNTSVALEITGA